MRRICRYLPALVLVLASIQIAGAQSLIDVNMGFGAGEVGKTNTGIEGDYSGVNSNNFEGPCTPSSADPTCASPQALKNFMFGIGANLMLWEHFGVGMDASFSGKTTYAAIPIENPSVIGGIQTLGQAGYAFQSRVTFYDFDGIYQPVKSSRASLQLIGGVGGANIKFYTNQSSGGVLGGSSYSSYLQSANHLNVHAGVGVQIYLTDHLFIRPQFDMHYVPNLEQYGSNIVKQEMVWVGYTIGDRK